MRSRYSFTFVLLLLVTTLSSCINLRESEREKIAELRSLGVRVDGQGSQSPGTVGALNVLPGMGNFYLGLTSPHSSQWPIGAVNVVLWPLSIAWAVPQGVVDARTANKLDTIDYYYHTESGRAALQGLKDAREEGSL